MGANAYLVRRHGLGGWGAVILVLFGVVVGWGVHDDRIAAAEAGRAGPAAKASAAARADIPARYLALYRQAGRRSGVPWQVLAGIGKVESDHGRSSAPGVRSGVNAFGCCAGPMQFNVRNGPRTTWDRYGRGSPYRPEDAIPAAARLLRANGAPGNLRGAVYSYNHDWGYVAQVLALAQRYRGR